MQVEIECAIYIISSSTKIQQKIWRIQFPLACEKSDKQYHPVQKYSRLWGGIGNPKTDLVNKPHFNRKGKTQMLGGQKLPILR